MSLDKSEGRFHLFCLFFVSSLASLETDGGGIRFTRTTEGNVTPSLFLLRQLKFFFSFLLFQCLFPIQYFTVLDSVLSSFR